MLTRKVIMAARVSTLLTAARLRLHVGSLRTIAASVPHTCKLAANKCRCRARVGGLLTAAEHLC